MNSTQAFEQAILLAMAILAVGALALVLSVILGRRRARNGSIIANLPATPRPTLSMEPRVSANPVREFRRDGIETNYGMF